ncbi:aminopeptidase P1 [Strigomonas culicis]|uniref:Aminopeptidase P1 n=1 Tax=Strigomonas culicis TaxID=28005 RepID=S9VRG9_9TRYP|nr:aminopeptidase P1 [Strigomonas culicis]EPY25795.1 aminopeptidase P1 [Strigomonas culicis]|eukprot:EPY20022.1 aminopeptidase P1 [Strigomonas culicis]
MCPFMSMRRGASAACRPLGIVSVCRRCFTPLHDGNNANSQYHPSAKDLAQRRRVLFSCMEANSIFILPAASSMYATNDILSSSFRQDTLFYHLFGLHVPMRRELAPSRHHLHTEDHVELNMAVFVKGAVSAASSDASVHKCFLFVGNKTTAKDVLVWDFESTDVQVVEGLLVDETSNTGPGDTRVHVQKNDIFTIAETIMTEIKAIAAAKVYDTQRAFLCSDRAAALSPSQLKRLNPLPTMTLHYPTQMSWSGQRYRLPTYVRARGAAADLCNDGSITVSSPSVLFHHPWEALLTLLCSSTVDIQLAQPLVIADKRNAKMPGRANSSPTQLKALRFQYEPAKVPSAGNVACLLCSERGPQQRNARAELAGAYTSLLHLTFALDNGRVEKEQEGVKGNGATEMEMAVITTPILPVAQTFMWHYRAIKLPGQLASFFLSAECTRFIIEKVMRQANEHRVGEAVHSSEFSIHCDIQSLLADTQRRAGPTHLVQSAYTPVIASGARGFHIHYTSNNNNTLEERVGTELVRLDFGVELNNIPIDCTRTFPLNNRTFFANHGTSVDNTGGGCSPAVATDALQRELYRGLLQLQRKLLLSIAEGVSVQSVAALHVALTQELLAEVGIYEQSGLEDRHTPSLGSVKTVFCAHSFGHFFGLDIHERVPIKFESAAAAPPRTSSAEAKRPTSRIAPTIFLGGMMHTVEPGVYIPPPALWPLLLDGAGGTPCAAALHVPAPLRQGLGMQVEDDVLVLPRGSATGSLSGPAGRHDARGDYLAAALRAFERALQWRHQVFGAPPCNRVLDLPPAVRTPYAFLFEQRCCIEGVEAALRKRESDVQTLTTHFIRDVNATFGFSSDGWYPYHIICLTAGVPKDEVALHNILAPD